MHLKEKLLNYIKAGNLFHRNDKLLVAVSGGLDSTVLTHLLHDAGYDIELMHMNFQLRGEESNRDENFVRGLGGKLGIPVHVKKVDADEYARENKLSKQVAARELRYAWFREMLSAVTGKKGWIVTAHQLDDNIETSFMNWVKGSGIRGLRGMLPKQNDIVRPLLAVGRDELLAYAKQNNLQWVEDSSNQRDDYARNFVRHQIIPLLDKINPQAQKNLAENLVRFRETEQVFDQAIEFYRKGLLLKKNTEWQIPVEKLKLVKPIHTIYYELVKSFGFIPAQMPDLVNLLNSDTGKFIASPSHRIIRNRNWLVIAPLATGETSLINVDGIGITEGPGFGLKITALEKSPETFEADPNTCYIPQHLLEFPLLLRKWKTGDYFYPLGMRKKKKLARFFIDQKLSATEKEQQWVLIMNDKIVWLPGLRLDDRFKVGERGEKVYKLKFRTT